MQSIIGWMIQKHYAMTGEALNALLKFAESNGPPKAIQTTNSRPLPGTRTAEVRGNVAILPIIGPIFPRENIFTFFFGGVSIETLAKDYTAALNNPAVKAIIFDVDSPGGEVTGLNEFSAMIRAGRRVKPIVAYVGGTAASGGYWLASAAGRIVADGTAVVGCIGIASVYRRNDPAEIDIVSTLSPNKWPDPATDAGYAQIRRTIDSLAEVFVAEVARNRGTTPETVLSKYGSGDVLVGKDAVSAGMIDSIGNFEQLIKQYQ